jgi:hypothetical protein
VVSAHVNARATIEVRLKTRHEAELPLTMSLRGLGSDICDWYVMAITVERGPICMLSVHAIYICVYVVKPISIIHIHIYMYHLQQLIIESCAG